MTTDEEIGQRIQALRGPVTSQAGLANAMKERGHDKWSQATVWSVESGKRPLRLAEAVSIAEILHVGLKELVRSDAVTAAFDQMRACLRAMATQNSQLREALRGYIEAQAVLRSTLSEKQELFDAAVGGDSSTRNDRVQSDMLKWARDLADEDIETTVKLLVKTLADASFDPKVRKLLAMWESRYPVDAQGGDSGVDPEAS